MTVKEHEKFTDSTLLEGMTSISAVINSGDMNNRKIEKVLIDTAKRKNKHAEIGFLTAKSHELGFGVEFVSTDEIDAITVGNSHGGIVALCSDRTLPALTAEAIKPDGFYVYLDGVEDPYNLGYTLRSLYAAGVDGVVLPARNWMTAAGVVARSSAGASELLPIFSAEADTLAPIFKSVGYTILCAGIRNSVSIFDEDFRYPLLLVVGGEKRGISRTILDRADHIVRIDYGRAFRGSLSAASAATVMAFELFRKNKAK
jgi:23S rRNA (guanosine2251-2'-O)-methyltransferase